MDDRREQSGEQEQTPAVQEQQIAAEESKETVETQETQETQKTQETQEMQEMQEMQETESAMQNETASLTPQDDMPDIPVQGGQQPDRAPRQARGPGYGFFLCVLIPCLALVLLGAVLLLTRAGGKSDSIFSSARPADPVPMQAYFSGAGKEVRGVYIASVYNINYPSKTGLSAGKLKSELDAILDTCDKNRMNAVYFQVSPNSDALYVSELLPVSSVITGKEGAALPGGFDPLAYLCTAAHARGITVHAWVNPVRVTTASLSFDALAKDNPARVHPEWTVEYGGSRYYNLGLPEVRALQASVCAELVREYPIDGILFDDYFYPYPVDGQAFDDAAAYAEYGGGYSDLGEFRRAGTTELVRACHDAIKAERANCAFGIAPFGIWQNDDGGNGGSPTRGLESYETLYCDTLGFARGGYVDYIAPQLYWQFSSAAAPYGALCDWWNAALAGTDVRLMISHAAYQAGEWNAPGEFADQVEYARNKKAYVGSIFYGYAALAANDGGICTDLARTYAAEYAYAGFYSTGEPVTAILRLDGTSITVKGTSDVAYPLICDGRSVSQNRDGSFAFTCALPADGKIVLTQNGVDYSFEIEK